MRIHFIAIGGAVMHNLAIALHKKGYTVTGSDDEIFEPSRSRLDKYGLLPCSEGWDASRIGRDIDAVILGMHAREDNPELIRARELGIRIYSFPEYLYEQTKDKKRVVIAGSHGKTTITSMVMHCLKFHGWKFDYMVGSMIDGFETMVGLSNDSEIAVFEGDEYLSSALDCRPKFHLYKPDIALISGIAWDHMNVFPTWENYLEQFSTFVDRMEPGGTLIYYEGDSHITEILTTTGRSLVKTGYTGHNHHIRSGQYYLEAGEKAWPVEVFGSHNMQNINGARLVCTQLGMTDNDFYEAIQTFRGSARRLELLGKSDTSNIYLDFAHAPSKVRATVQAMKEKYPDRLLVAVLELHTFSSLNAAFLPHYKGTLDLADIPMVYFNPATVEHKRLPMITAGQVKEAFGRDDLHVYTDSAVLLHILSRIKWHFKNLLIMTSGNFDGLDFTTLIHPEK
jgi:UDP-N-acetylmuramate: L-alanyl-gamma-D-glutamyl-meso-diaminopimelate ligase